MMGLFSRRPDDNAVIVAEPGKVIVDQGIKDDLPDPGVILLTLLSGLPAESIEQVESELTRVRHPNGSLPKVLRQDLPFKPSAGPLHLLDWITSGDWVIVGVWATWNLRGRAKREIEAACGQLINSQGIPAAVTWTITTRGSVPLSLDHLANQLSDSYLKHADQITNKTVIDCFRKWNH